MIYPQNHRFIALEIVTYSSFTTKLPYQVNARDRVVSACLTLSEDMNPKLCMTGLDCLQSMIECQSDSFEPYFDVTFKLLIVKYGDEKVRERRSACNII